MDPQVIELEEVVRKYGGRISSKIDWQVNRAVMVSNSESQESALVVKELLKRNIPIVSPSWIYATLRNTTLLSRQLADPKHFELRGIPSQEGIRDTNFSEHDEMLTKLLSFTRSRPVVDKMPRQGSMFLQNSKDFVRLSRSLQNSIHLKLTTSVILS